MIALWIFIGVIFLVAMLGNIGEPGGPFGGPPDEEY